MVDRLEELLAQMADEDDEEQEDALALGAARAPVAAPAPGSEGRREGRPNLGSRTDLESWEGTGQSEPEAAPTPTEYGEHGELWAAIPRMVRERPPEEDGPASAHGNGLAATRALRAGDGQATEGDAPAPAPGAAADRGLEELYRRTAQASRPAAQGLPVEQAGRTRGAEEPGRTAALTVDELDRAVRRDSRRYDGGMSIF